MSTPAQPRQDAQTSSGTIRRVRVGSILRNAAGQRFVVRAIKERAALGAEAEAAE
jgi:hypothetical protein